MNPEHEKYLHKVVRIKKPLFEDDYLEEGMMARIKGIRNEHDDMLVITFDISEFEAFNKSRETTGYWDKDRRPILTASQAGYYPKNHIDDCYLMDTDNFADYMEIIENELDTPAKMLETLKLAYRFALDNAVIGEKGERLTKEEEKELGKRLFHYWGVK